MWALILILAYGVFVVLFETRLEKKAEERSRRR
jgi:hypothetical protein